MAWLRLKSGNQPANAAVKAKGTIFAIVPPSRSAPGTRTSHRRERPSALSPDPDDSSPAIRHEERGTAITKEARARKMIRELRSLGYRVEALSEGFRASTSDG